MSIIAMLASALAGSGAAAGGAAAAGAGTAATAGTAAAGSTFLGGIMDKAGAAISTIGEYAGAASDAVGMTDFAGDAKLEDLNKQLQILNDEAEAIKAGTEYASEADRDLDLASNATRTQETIAEIDKLTAEKAKAAQSGLSGTLGSNASAGSMSAPAIISSGGINAGSFDPNALTGAAMSGLTGTLGGAPKTTQQQLIMAQNQSLGGFRL